MKTRIIGILAVLGLAALAYAWTAGLPPFEPAEPASSQAGQGRGNGGGQQQGKTVAVAPVERTQLTDRVSAVGTLRARESVVVTAEAAGMVRDVLFDHGATVERGAVLLRLDDAEARAQLAAARATLTNAQRAYDRASQLRRNGTIAQPVYDEAAAALESARSAVAVAELTLEKRTIRAPFAGRLGFREVSVGAYLTPGAEITTLDDVAVVYADFGVPEASLPALAPGQTVDLISAAHPGVRFAGRVLTVGSRVDAASRQVRVRAEVPNADGRLRPGQMVSADVAVAERLAVTVPSAAVVAVGYQHFAFVIGDDGRAERRIVRLGTRTSDRVEITDGLREGERLVVEGAAKLDGGDRVREVPALAVGTAAAPES
ncbi:efflux RND transporter periplasmic adaptor subunit [Caenispirillum bisanense]|uniref:efflux RND transporter periplasmic adaptor subunit n=1 Tax=Caenispirillum bisanense TaxID=414052 RepID=UPI0031DF5C65